MIDKYKEIHINWRNNKIMESRTKNTKRNIYASFLLMAVQMIFQFVSRSVVVYVLGENYLGLSSLFTSILTVLNVAELGFSSSIIYFMYKPIAEGNTERVCALLAFYKEIYERIGIVILSVGLAVTPFITKIISGDIPTGVNIYFLYLLYLTNTSISYFLFSYKTALLTALQRLDLTKIAHTVVAFIQYGLQILSLIVFHNYYLFVLLMIIGTASNNVFAAIISRRYYPEYTCKGDLANGVKKEIAKKVKGLMICNISGVTYTALDSIIISAFVGLSSVAIYNNYIVIYSAVTSMVMIVRQAMQASVGNSVAKESVEKNKNDMFLWQFLFSVIATFCTTCLICLYQPFMCIWMGEKMLLPMIDVILIGIWFMVGIVQHAYFLYLTGNGLWDEMKWSYVFNTICNLVLNIVLGKWIGVTGIILASLFSCFVSGIFWQCIIVFKHYYKSSAKKYILSQFLYFIIAGVIVGITYYLCHFVTMGGWKELIVKAFICVFITPLFIILFYYKSQYYYRAKRLLKTLTSRFE